jgi:hypothetical protein
MITELIYCSSGIYWLTTIKYLKTKALIEGTTRLESVRRANQELRRLMVQPH